MWFSGQVATDEPETTIRLRNAEGEEEPLQTGYAGLTNISIVPGYEMIMFAEDAVLEVQTTDEGNMIAVPHDPEGHKKYVFL